MHDPVAVINTVTGAEGFIPASALQNFPNWVPINQAPTDPPTDDGGPQDPPADPPADDTSPQSPANRRQRSNRSSS